MFGMNLRAAGLRSGAAAICLKWSARGYASLAAGLFAVLALGGVGQGQDAASYPYVPSVCADCDCNCCPISIADETFCGPPTLFAWRGGEAYDPEATRGPLATDRPDFTESTSTVGLGLRQLELGYTYFYDEVGGDSDTAHSYPEALFRFGMFAEWLEFRIAYNYASLSERRNGMISNFDGSEDLYLGAKIGLAQQDGLLPDLTIMPQMTVPTGSGVMTQGKVLPGVNLLYGWEINDFLCCAGSTQGNAAIDGNTGSDYLEMAQSFTIGYTLTEKLGAFTEWFVITPVGADTAQTVHYLDTGLTYRVTDNLQLDIRIGKGISGPATDYFAGSGLAVRF